jgi:hypothetical protein
MQVRTVAPLTSGGWGGSGGSLDMSLGADTTTHLKQGVR